MRLALAAFLIFTASAAAQTPAPEPAPAPAVAQADPLQAAMLAKMYDGVTFDEFEAIIKAGGYGYTRHEGQNGPYIETGTARGVSYELWLSECGDAATGGRCTGMSMQTLFFKESPKVTLKALNDWNLNAWGARAMIYSTGQSAVAMNIGLGGGVTGDWVLRRMANFNYWADAYNEFWTTGNPKAVPAPAE